MTLLLIIQIVTKFHKFKKEKKERENLKNKFPESINVQLIFVKDHMGNIIRTENSLN